MMVVHVDYHIHLQESPTPFYRDETLNGYGYGPVWAPIGHGMADFVGSTIHFQLITVIHIGNPAAS